MQSDSPTFGPVLLVSTRPLFLRTFAKLLSTLRPSLETHALAGLEEPWPDGHAAFVALDLARASGEVVGVRVREWLARDATLLVVAVLDEADDAVVEAAMAAGAAGVMIKSAPPGVLAEWLDALLDGARVRPAPSVALAPEALGEALRARLSARRQKLLRLQMGGTSVTATARALAMTPDKVVTEMRIVMDIIRGHDASD